MTLEEMWNRLAVHQPFADARGYGPEWANMCNERTPIAADQAANAEEAWLRGLIVDEQLQVVLFDDVSRATARAWRDAAWAVAEAVRAVEYAVRLVKEAEEHK